MRAVVQRVKSATVRVDGAVKGLIQNGLLVYLGAESGDTNKDVEYVASKVAGLRVFEDREDREDRDKKMNLSVKNIGGGVLVVSQFTLLGDTRKGRRPSFERALSPDAARELYTEFIERLTQEGLTVEQGEFRAMMEVESVNDGPVTLLIDSRKVF